MGTITKGKKIRKNKKVNPVEKCVSLVDKKILLCYNGYVIRCNRFVFFKLIFLEERYEIYKKSN